MTQSLANPPPSVGPVNQRDAIMFQSAARLPGLIQASNVMSPEALADPAGNVTPVVLVNVKPFRLVSVYLVAPLIVPEGVVDAGEIEFQTVGELAASEDALFPSRLTTRLLVTIAAFAAGGVSRNVKPDASSATSATNEVPLRRNSRTLR